jgi:molecular chaperone GrpE
VTPFGDDVPDGTHAAGPDAAPRGTGRSKGGGARRDGPKPAAAGRSAAPPDETGAPAPVPPSEEPTDAPPQAAPATEASPAAEGSQSGTGAKGDLFRLDDLGLADLDQIADEIVEGELVGRAPSASDLAAIDAAARDAAAAAGIPELSAVERLAAERDEYLDALRRLQADFVNFRNRVERQHSEEANRKVEALIDRLLPVLDATQLAAEHAEDEKDGAAIAQVASLLWDTLAKVGLERVDAAGVPFDPVVHDAVLHVPADADADAGSEGEGKSKGKGKVEDVGPVVDAVLRPGFLFRGKCLRPAMVQVRG